MNYRAMIAEDEAPQRRALASFLEQLWPQLQLSICEDGISALESLDAAPPDIAFLDIRMPGVDGLTVARALPRHCIVVFTTAYDEYAVRAFELGAIDYLLKPIRLERLQQCLSRVRERLRGGQVPDIAATLAAIEARPAADERLRWISASVGDALRLTSIDEVLAFHAQDKYTRVLTANTEAVIRTPLKELMARLDPALFTQLHRSLIARIDAIAELRKDQLGHWQMRLKARNELFPVSQALATRFRPM